MYQINFATRYHKVQKTPGSLSKKSKKQYDDRLKDTLENEISKKFKSTFGEDRYTEEAKKIPGVEHMNLQALAVAYKIRKELGGKLEEVYDLFDDKKFQKDLLDNKVEVDKYLNDEIDTSPFTDKTKTYKLNILRDFNDLLETNVNAFKGKLVGKDNKSKKFDVTKHKALIIMYLKAIKENETPSYGKKDEDSDEEASDEEGSDEEGSDEEGSDEEGSDEEGSDEEGSDEESDEESSSSEEIKKKPKATKKSPAKSTKKVTKKTKSTKKATKKEKPLSKAVKKKT
jgi:hypothetical protein